MNGLPKLYLVRELSEHIQVHKNTINQWCREGKIKAFRFTEGGTWRIPESEVRRLLEQGCE